MITLKPKLTDTLKNLYGKKIISITECTGPIPCICIELNNCWIDIAVGISPIDGRVHFPVHQIVKKDKETIAARKNQKRK